MFKLDEEIEVSDYRDFREGIVIIFKHQDPKDGEHYGVDADGYMQSGRYARKIVPKVTVYFLNKLEGFIGHEISQELADKIKGGEDV